MLQAHQQLNCRPRASQSTSRCVTALLQPLQHLHAPSLTRHTRRHPPAVAAAAGPNHLPNRSTQGSTVRSPTHSGLQQSALSTNSSSSSSSSWWSRLDWELLLLVSALPAPAALAAEDGLKYDSSRGEGIVKTLSGGLYIGLLLYFLFKVLNRRARKAREEVRPALQRCHSMLAVWHAHSCDAQAIAALIPSNCLVSDSEFCDGSATSAGMLIWAMWKYRLPP
jgi:hypothetical protein